MKPGPCGPRTMLAERRRVTSLGTTILNAMILIVAACGGSPIASQSATGLLAPSAQPTTAGTSAQASLDAGDMTTTGSLVFFRYDLENRAQIWVSCSDLTKLRQLPGRPGYSAGWPVWSPTGARIAFNANYEDPDPRRADETDVWDIYTMDRDGGDVVRLTAATALMADPDYSPDGTLIAYTSDEPDDEGVWVMNATDGSGARLVTPRPRAARVDYAPRFSPDGTEIVFTREVSDDEGALWVVNLDGSDLRRITPETHIPYKGDWAPNGSRIVFTSEFEGGKSAILTVAPDGTNLTNLTPTPSTPGAIDGWSHPIWSPDGDFILSVHGLHPGPSRLGLAIMRADGSGLRWLSDGPSVYEKTPDWTAAPC